MKRHYARRLKDFTPQGSATINQAQFNLLYQEARSQSFTKQYCQAGWSRTGIYPWNPSRIINHPMVQSYRSTEPNLIPSPVRNNSMYITPTKAFEYQAIISQINEKLTPLSSRQLRRLEHAIIKENSARILLQQSESIARKHHREEERVEVNKRLKKSDESIT